MTNKDVTLRDFVEEDIDQVVALTEELGLSRWSREDYLAELARSDSHMHVALRLEKLIGFIVGRNIPGSRDETGLDAEIYNIGVHRSEQGSGVGRVLLCSVLDECRRKNVQLVWLEVRVKNANAISFYEKAGFTQFAARPKFYTDPPDDGIVMRLSLV
ncbi:MAG: ribosomal protein S18-alanine N-acetyltransferase [Acidobacteria bacterium]|nr:ribosomal protein S18-alanine N-acetyltransferase [Acidobacteriota bacterium]